MEVEAFMHRSAKALLYVGLYINSSWLWSNPSEGFLMLSALPLSIAKPQSILKPHNL